MTQEKIAKSVQLLGRNGVETPLILAVVFRCIHGFVCQCDQGAWVIPMLMAYGDTHAGTDRNHMMPNIYGLSEINEQAI